MRCAACGYFEPTHVGGRCPVCVCGEVVSAHRPCADPPSPLLAFAEKGRVLYRCPGKETQLRHGKFGAEVPVERYPWHGMLPAVTPSQQAERDAAAALKRVITGPPQVPARPPIGPWEFAGFQGKQAVGLGRAAMGAGWNVVPLYWRARDGAEGCGVWLSRGRLRALATWKRPAGKQGGKSGWSTDLAYAWRVDVDRFPSKLTTTELEGLIK